MDKPKTATEAPTSVTLSLEVPHETQQMMYHSHEAFSNLGDEGFKIEGINDFQFLGEQLSVLQGEISEAKKARDELTGPFNLHKKAVIDQFRSFEDWSADVMAKGRKAMASYTTAQEQKIAREQAAADEKARKKADKLRERADKAFADGREEKGHQLDMEASSVAPAAVQTAEVPKTAGVARGSTWELTGADESKAIEFIAANPILAGVLSIDWVKLRAMYKAQGRDLRIPGIVARQTATVSIRSRK